jgi:energy-coupling factor transporter ATP-binding protein EcfA2
MPSEPPSPEAARPAHWQHVSVRYPFADKAAVGPVELTVGAGERLLLLGSSGSGKSTLLLTLTGLIPQSIPADVEGSVRLFGEPVDERKPYFWATTVAQFFQDADQTLCGMRVEDEIAFALENRALPEDVITRKVTEAMRFVGLSEEWRRRRTTTLSGGERQLVALAATLAQEAPLFVADEPTAHLAPAVANRLHLLLMEKTGKPRSVLIVDHRLDGLIGSVDRVAVLGSDGTIAAAGPPGAVFREKRDLLDALGIWRPLASFLDAELENVRLAPADPPLAVNDALRHLDVASPEIIKKARMTVANFVAAHSARPVDYPCGGEIVARLEAADCAPFLGPTVLHNVTLDLRAGEVLGILGANGVGKSTLGASLAGVLKLKRGRREGAPGGIAFQNPENQFTAGTVRQEIATSLPKSHEPEQVDDILAAWDLAGLQNRHPFELSHGQKRRLALATLSAGDRWPLIILDEPMAGLDAKGAAMIVRHVEALRLADRAIAIITHDMDFALRLCPRSVILGEGGILAQGPTRELMADAELLKRAGLAEPVIAPAMRWLEQAPAC